MSKLRINITNLKSQHEAARMPDETAYYGARFYFIWEGAVRPYSFSQPSAVRKRSKAARPSGVSLNTPACSRHVSNFAPISRFTASCACSGESAVPYFFTKRSSQSACSGAAALHAFASVWPHSTAAMASLCCARRLGRMARPITSMRPMFSFLMWWISRCGWKIPSGYCSVVRLLRGTRSST